MDKPLEEIVFLVEEAEEGGYIAKSLGASIVTEADNIGDLKRQVIDAVRCHFTGAEHSPRLIRLHLVKDEVFAV